MTDKPMTQREIEALDDIKHTCNASYIWKQASMRKLEARGLVQRTGAMIGKLPVWKLVKP